MCKAVARVFNPCREACSRWEARVKNPCYMLAISVFALCFVGVGCRKEDMADQPRQDTMDESRFFPDGQSARPLIDGTVPRGHRPIHDVIVAVSSGTNEPEATSFPNDVKV